MRKERMILAAAFVLIVGLAFYFYSRNNNGKSRYQWFKTFNDNKKQPYAFGKFKDLLSYDSKLFKVLDSEIELTLAAHDSNQKATYVFIGQSYFLNKRELSVLNNFIEKGNNVLIIAEEFPKALLDQINANDKYLQLGRMDTKDVRVEILNSNSQLKVFDFTYMGFKKKPSVTEWMYFETNNNIYFLQKPYVKQSAINGEANQVLLMKGNGRMAINTTPMLFTNYAMYQENGFDYVNEMVSNIKTPIVYYDIFSRKFKSDASDMQRKPDSPLSYILKNKSLRTAWYLFLALVVLFLLFKAKRIQKVIPVIERKRNMTLGFVETLSRMHYNRADHKQMAINQMQIFLFFLRNKLQIPTGVIDARTIKHISIKSNVPESHVHDIFEFYKNTVETSDDLSQEYLMKFYNMINKFYKTYQKKQ